jgi:hypothetical protein
LLGGSHGWRQRGDDHVNPEADQLRGKRGQALEAPFPVPSLDHDVAPLGVAKGGKSLEESLQVGRIVLRRQMGQVADADDPRRRLRLGRDRCSEKTAGHACDECSSVHYWII